MECDREGADPKAARVYSAKTREFAAPRARLIMKRMRLELKSESYRAVLPAQRI